ncbi:MAG: DNA primase [Rikenellaceae bacterium]|nr:DNA primase [Rikenellaceae bacterium]
MIDRLTVDRIYSAADIVEVVGDFVSLRKKGINYQACCPFHNEKTPSFVVSPTKGLFKCFGCGKGGNAVTFVMEHEGMSYPEALKYVAKKYGIEVSERELSPEEEKKNDDRESMMVATAFAAEWFSRTLWETDEGRSVGLGYFRKRGLADGTVTRFGLGYCPPKGEAFSTAALAAGYKDEFLVRAGLSGKRENGTLYDKFYDRVIFPIHSVSGRVIGFGGRTLRSDKKTAKYVNSPESEIYHKSNVLYGLFFAKKAITQEDCCILVEGYTDVISMHQAGVENVVASSGTALTPEQVRLISRFTKNITVIFDGDSAGINASMRGIDIILKEGMNVRIVPLSPGEDPDSFARSRSAAGLKEYIASNEEDFITFKTRILLGEAGGDPIKKGGLITEIVSSVAVVPDPIMRSLYIKQTASSMDIPHEVLASEVARKRISHDSDAQTRDFIRRQEEIRRRERTPESLSGPESGEDRPLSSIAGSSVEELEKELVKYLLKYGGRYFDYKEGRSVVSFNVAETIINDIEANGLSFSDGRYRKLYETYRELFYRLRTTDGTEGPEVNINETIGLHNFINHPDPEVCNAAVDILTDNDNYVVSKLWQKYDIIVENESDKLAESVPRTVILYKSKAIERIIADLRGQLGREGLSDEELAEVTFRISTLNRERMAIAKKLSRLIL